MLQNCPKCNREVEPHGLDIDWIPTFDDPDSGSTNTPYYIHCECGFKYDPKLYDWDDFEKGWNSIEK